MLDQLPFVKKLPFWKKDIIENETNKISKFTREAIIDFRQKLDSLSSKDSSNILSILLSAIDENGIGFSDEEVKQEAMAMIFAGHEASSNLMTWCFYVLMTQAKIYQACQNEVDRVFSDGQPLDLLKLNELEVLDAVIYETLRLYPPVPTIRRECIQEHHIGPSNRELQIPIGTTISIDVYGVHRSPRYWQDPSTFDYRRWMGAERRKNLSNSYCFLSFSGGNRNCMGQPFALLEAKAVLSMLLRRLDFEIVKGQQILPDIRLTMKPKYGLLAKIKPRTL
ncbi:unnamed protein product [Adineta steineri]|uniref:Cytochrome P450 n=1 Tax=Adineta steineri TaxID=433720 RepID=A0A819B5E9_9BILA|nr:unnamed protein product [Adineta steineri]CAF3796293.1 unnamed protein product [Adineta steineri]